MDVWMYACIYVAPQAFFVHITTATAVAISIGQDRASGEDLQPEKRKGVRRIDIYVLDRSSGGSGSGSGIGSVNGSGCTGVGPDPSRFIPGSISGSTRGTISVFRVFAPPFHRINEVPVAIPSIPSHPEFSPIAARRLTAVSIQHPILASVSHSPFPLPRVDIILFPLSRCCAFIFDSSSLRFRANSSIRLTEAFSKPSAMAPLALTRCLSSFSCFKRAYACIR